MNRLEEFDIMKGVLIILVVIGHTSLLPQYWNEVVFWFHMPVFFMITGVLTNKWISFENKNLLKHKFISLAIPYFSYCTFFYLIMGNDSVGKFLVKTLLAGRLNITQYSFPYWYIGSLFIALFAYGTIRASKQNFKLLIINRLSHRRVILAYVIIHIASLCHYVPCLPWGIDTAIGAIPYIFVGDLFKKYNYKRWHITFAILPIIIIFGFKLISFQYKLNMASMVYNHILLDLLIPIVFGFALYQMAMLCRNTPIQSILSVCGRNSLTIFYLHAAVLSCESINIYLRILLAISGGIMLQAMFEKYRLLRFLFLGKRS